MALVSLDDLRGLPNMKDIMKIDVSKNHLENIDILNHLKRLEVLVASDNYITEVKLKLPRL